MSEHDVVVIGAGPAGEVCAGKLAREGSDVALVERELVGGECAFWACMPSKALLRPAELLAEVKRVPGAREALGGGLDTPAALARRDQVIHNLDDSVQLVVPHRRRRQPLTNASSSPRSASSATMSLPPTNFPLMYTCGIVGQFE